MTLAAIDAGQLAEVVWVSLLAGVAITTAYSLVVFGTARAADARRAGHSGAGYMALAATMLCLCAGAIVFAVHVMLKK